MAGTEEPGQQEGEKQNPSSYSLTKDATLIVSLILI
jgi:hypothetical protein